MLASIQLRSKSILVAGAFAFLFVGAVTPGLAMGGGGHGGSSGYFPGITNCCGGGGGDPGGGGFQARDAGGARYHDQSCNPNFSQPMPLYCRNR